MKWFLASIGALLLWGVWGVLLKRVSQGAGVWEVYAGTNLAIVAAVFTLLALEGPQLIVGRGLRWLGLAMATGAFGTIGYVLLVQALNWGGRASIVIPLTGLYPVVTAVLSWLLLGEQITLRQAAGIGLAAVAIVLLSPAD